MYKIHYFSVCLCVCVISMCGYTRNPIDTYLFLLQHTTGLWASLGNELFFENGLIVKSINATGHFLLYDARLEDPDGMLMLHLCPN